MHNVFQPIACCGSCKYVVLSNIFKVMTLISVYFLSGGYDFCSLLQEMKRNVTFVFVTAFQMQGFY